MHRTYFFALSAFFLSAILTAKEAVATEKVTEHNLYFIENKGQIIDQFERSRNDIQFAINVNRTSVFIGNGQIHYQFSTVGETFSQEKSTTSFRYLSSFQSDKLDIYRLDVSLLGANVNAKIITSEVQPYYEQYYTHQLNGVTANAYKKITYKDVYPFIDWVIYTADGQLKYDFIVHKGGDVSQIKLAYDGATSLTLSVEGDLVAVTPLGSIVEHPPYTYDGMNMAIPSKFVLKGNILSYAISARKDELTIDPAVRVWGSYIGGNASDEAERLATDTAGNVYVAGTTSSTIYMATIGAFQTVYGGSTDAFLAKFDTDGGMNWTTYIGGSSGENGRSVACDAGGSVYIAGDTWSANLGTSGTHMPNHSLGVDAFLMKFSSSGQRLWATYFGDSLEDHGYDVVLDAANNVYLAGYTYSNYNIATAGKHKTHCDYVDGYLAKFNNSGQRVWGSYLGGAGIEYTTFAHYDHATNAIYLGGATNSDTGIGTPGVFQDTAPSPSFSNSMVAYLAKMDTAGNRLWGTYYGPFINEFGQSVVTNDSGDVYFGCIVPSSTSSSTGIISPGAYQSSGSGVLAKLTKDGLRQWATFVYGWPRDLAVDYSGNVIVAGSTSDYNIATPGAWQPSYQGGAGDGFLEKWGKDGQKLMSTYYGSVDLDEIRGVAYNHVNNGIYACGRTNLGNFAFYLGSAGSAHPTPLGGTTDGFVARFRNDTVVYLNYPLNPTQLCAGNSYTFHYTSDTFKTGNTFSIQIFNTSSSLWQTIGSTNAVTSGSINCTIPIGTIMGEYSFRIVGSNPAFEAMPAQSHVYVGSPLSGSVTIASDSMVCERDSINLFANYVGAGSISQYTWKGPNNYKAVGLHVWIDSSKLSHSGSYIVSAQSYGCHPALDTISIVVQASPDTPLAFIDLPACLADTIFFHASNSTNPGVIYDWNGPNGFTSSLANPFLPFSNWSDTGMYFVSSVRNSCKSLPVKVAVLLTDKVYPNVSIAASPTGVVSPWNPITFFIRSITDSGSSPAYQWLKNGLDITGETTSTFTSSVLSNNDEISLRMSSSIPCADPVISNPVKVQLNTGIVTFEGSSDIRLYPTPNNGNFTLDANLSNGDVTVEIMDVLGRCMYKNILSTPYGKLHQYLELSENLEAGIYLLRLAQNARVVTKKFTINR